ncbi:predicted protein, partial [Nematostella vectensis]
CRPLNVPETKHICSNRVHRVVKVLTSRLPKLDVSLIEGFSQEGEEVKVLHLVRDPRAVVASLQKVRWLEAPGTAGASFSSRVQTFCEAMLETLDFILKAEASLYGKYKLLRYEDLVADVYRTSKELFHFVGIARGTESINRWIRMSINAKTDVTSETYEYQTTRANMTSLIHAWKSRLSEKQIRTVEWYCKPMMVAHGYTPMFVQ